MKLERNVITHHSARQMFELVNAIETYPQFLPWCHSARVISQSEKEVQAEIEIAWTGIHKRFSTHNILQPFSRIEMRLIEGPLSHLEGIWDFIPLNEQTCKVCLELDFEFTKSLVDRMFQPIFNHIANNLVDAFVKRAAEIYHEN